MDLKIFGLCHIELLQEFRYFFRLSILFAPIIGHEEVRAIGISATSSSSFIDPFFARTELDAAVH